MSASQSPTEQSNRAQYFSRLSFAISLLLLAPVLQSSAAELSALVTGQSPDNKPGSAPACATRLEGSLRRLGFRVADRNSDLCEADLLVRIGIQSRRTRSTKRYEVLCNLLLFKPTGGAIDANGNPLPSPDCRASASSRGVKIRGEQIAELKALGSSSSNSKLALYEACQEIDEKMKVEIERAMGAVLAATPTIKLTLRWSGRLQPMPLIKVTELLKQLDLPPELLSSDATHCRFKISVIDDSLQQIQSKIQKLLLQHYEISAVSANTSKVSRVLEFHLKSKP